ncbi:MAG: regulatory protein RecX [Minisyncoccia bacterium]
MEEKNLALQFAMKLIGLRRRSVFEIEKRLQQKNYPCDIIDQVIKELKGFGYLNDEKFAESYVSDRINFRPCGRQLLVKELRERGVEESVAENKINELLDSEKEMALAEKMLIKKMKFTDKNAGKNKLYKKYASFLQSKGFSFDIISKALENKLK